jgi:hypothetical protein
MSFFFAYYDKTDQGCDLISHGDDYGAVVSPVRHLFRRYLKKMRPMRQ